MPQPDDPTQAPARWERAGAWALGLAAAALALWRALTPELPGDLSAYLAGAAAFWSGHLPYGPALTEHPLYQGYPFVYHPGALYLMAPLAWAPARASAALAALAHVGALAWCARQLTRRLRLPAPWPLLAPAALLLWPALVDLKVGNLATIMLAAALASAALAAQEPGPRTGLLGGAALGALLILKPMWGLVALWPALHRRARWLVAGLALGAGLGLGLGALSPELWGPWWQTARAARRAWPTVDLGRLGPWAWGAGLALWAGGGAWLLRRRPDHPHAWMWGFASLPLWPHLNTYTFVAGLPLLARLWPRHGPLPALLAALPASAMAMALLPEGPPGRLGRLGVLYGWSVGVSAALLVDLVRGAPRAAQDAAHQEEEEET